MSIPDTCEAWVIDGCAVRRGGMSADAWKDRTKGKDCMKPIVMVGVVCIVLGLAALAYQGITYTTREKVIDVGPLQVTAEKEHAIWLPPLLGVVAVGTGVVLVVVGARRS